METKRAQLKVLAEENALIPERQHKWDAGLDLKAAESVMLPPKQWKLVRSGVKAVIPEGFVGLVCPRSGLALKHGVTVLNAPGIIDSEYRGDIGVILINLSEKPYTIEKGDRIAQLVLTPVEYFAIYPLSEATFEKYYKTKRGGGGFGSTGK
jgi:dUTP pyrophosphatase